MMEVAPMSLHLAPDAVRRAHTQFNASLNVIGRQYLLCLGYKSIYIILFCQLQLGQLFLQLVILTRTAVTERQVFKLSLHIIQTETISQRRIEIVSLRSYLHLLVGTHTAQCSHIMKTVGQLHQYGTHIKLHRR